MKTSGLFRVHSLTVNCRLNEPLTLVIFGDVHRDSPNHADGAWQGFLERGRKLKKALFLGMGDYLDSGSSSERACFASARELLHETTLTDLQDLAYRKVKLLGKELSFLKNRCVGLLNGNHFYNFSDGTNSDQALCRELGCQYLGVSCFVRMYLDVSGCQQALDIWAHHGAGASRLPGGSINRVENMREHAAADMYIMGHDHKRMAVPATPRLFLAHSSKTGLELRQRHQWLIRSGSFMTSYRDGEVNYNVDCGRGPCSLGHVEMILTPRKTVSAGRHTWRIDMQALT